MSETRKVTLTTINNTALTLNSNNSISASATCRLGAEFLSQSNKTVNTTKNEDSGVRLNIELFQTDSNKYPEFNYSKLVHLEKKRLKKSRQKCNGLTDDFDDNDGDAIKRIANELERKYGSSYGSGRSKNKRGDYDIGMGYDESDSFIDNSEAYDEIIPDEVETIEGGFYINCGALEFKQLHTESLTTKTDEIIKMPKRPIKRVVSSSFEDSSSLDDDDDDDDEETDDNDNDESIEESTNDMPKYRDGENFVHQKQKPISGEDTSKHSLMKNKISSEQGNAMKKSAHASIRKNHTIGVTQSHSSSSSPKQTDANSFGGGDEDGGGARLDNCIVGRSDSERERMEKTTTVKDMLKAQRDQFLKSQHSNEIKPYTNGVDNNKVKSYGDSNCDNGEDNDDSDNDVSLSHDSEDKETDEYSDSNHSRSQRENHNQQQHKTQKNYHTVNKKEATTLIEKLRTTDTKLPEMDGKILNNIIEFRDTLISKNLTGKRFQFNEKSVEDFLKIDDCLVSDKTQRNSVYAHLEYHLALPKYTLLRKLRQLRIKEEKMKIKKAFHKLHKAVTEVMPTVIASYEAELRKYAELQAAHVNSDQPLKMPKKKFPWNHNLRNLLYDVYQMRSKSYPVLATRKDTLSMFIADYMTQKVVKIWPNGWMCYEELEGEIEKRKITNKKNEKKKLDAFQQQQLQQQVPTATSGAIAGPTSATIGITQPSMNLMVGTMHSATGPNAFMKQFEEFATTRSNANSDTDSVASSSTSASLKRKHQDVNSDTTVTVSQSNNHIQGSKTKIVKNHNDCITSNKLNLKDSQQQQQGLSPKRSQEELVSTFNNNKKIDNNINHIAISVAPVTLPSTPLTVSNALIINNNHTSTANINTSTSNYLSNNTATAGNSFKQSDAGHVIDLDNYKNLYDFLNTTNAVQAATTLAMVHSSTSQSPLLSSSTKFMATTSRRESSGDSEIEIVGVYKAKNPIKQRTNKSHKRKNNSNSNNNNNNSITYQQNVEKIKVFSIDKSKSSSSNKGKHSKRNKHSKPTNLTATTTTDLLNVTTTMTATTTPVISLANLHKIDNITIEPMQLSVIPSYMKSQ